MSYILEALKKADAERELGAVPDLHAQPVPLAAAYAGASPHAAMPWLWLVAGAVIALLVVLAWQFSGSDPLPGVTPVPPAVPAPAAVLVAPAAAPMTPTGPIAPGAPGTPPATEPLPAPAPSPAARDEAETLAKPATQPAPRKLSRQPAAASGAAASAPVKAAKAPPAAAPTTRAPLLTELPEEIRRQVPAMTIGGSVYSPQPANRMVIINGQVFREGSVVTPGLTLEQIDPKAAVFSLRGQRFEMPF